jgi:chromosome partitioning protein
MSPTTITLAASKGGVGKSTLAAALAVRATKAGGSEVAVLDWEPQGSLTLWWALRGKPANPQVIQDCDDPAAAISRLSANFVFIDTPPANLDRIAQAIGVATVVLIPVRASLFDIAAVREVVAICKERRKPFGFVLNADEPRRTGLRSSSLQALEKMGPIIGIPIQNRSVYVSALNTGKTGPEHKDKKQAQDAAAEIDALWDAVKAMLAKAKTR